VTIFGAPWSELKLEHVQTYLDQADDEPLLWEAKGTKVDPKEVRRQVCAFANSHEGGYLILGAEDASGHESESRWVLDGVQFPGGEPQTWISNVVGDLALGVRPRPDFDVAAWAAPNGHVAVVRVTATSTPPCLANGTVYERLPGKTQPVCDPLLLAGLFSRGDTARREAEARADRAALIVLDDWLGGDAGVFRTAWVPLDAKAEDDTDENTDDTAHVRFAVGVAATGNPPNISGRLFRDELVEDVWNELRDRPTGMPPELGRPPDPVTPSQDALTWRHHVRSHVDVITIVRAAWDGSVASGEKLSWEDVYPDNLAESRIAAAWRYAERLLERLGGFGDIYVTVRVAGGRFPRRKEAGHIVMRRGPLLPGVDDEHVASLGRELMRAVGNLAAEP
jgi:hypothetical protein